MFLETTKSRRTHYNILLPHFVFVVRTWCIRLLKNRPVLCRYFAPCHHTFHSVSLHHLDHTLKVLCSLRQ
jgi:hypothetical protein